MKSLKSLGLATICAITLCTTSSTIKADGFEYGKLNLLSSKSEFAPALEAEYVVVKFSANWCTSCIQLTSVFEDLAQNYENILFVEIDIDSFKSLSTSYGVRSIPTVFFFKNGEKALRTVGFRSEDFWATKISETFNL